MFGLLLDPEVRNSTGPCTPFSKNSRFEALAGCRLNKAKKNRALTCPGSGAMLLLCRRPMCARLEATGRICGCLCRLIAAIRGQLSSCDSHADSRSTWQRAVARPFAMHSCGAQAPQACELRPTCPQPRQVVRACESNQIFLRRLGQISFYCHSFWCASSVSSLAPSCCSKVR